MYVFMYLGNITHEKDIWPSKETLIKQQLYKYFFFRNVRKQLSSFNVDCSSCNPFSFKQSAAKDALLLERNSFSDLKYKLFIKMNHKC